MVIEINGERYEVKEQVGNAMYDLIVSVEELEEELKVFRVENMYQLIAN